MARELRQRCAGQRALPESVQQLSSGARARSRDLRFHQAEELGGLDFPRVAKMLGKPAEFVLILDQQFMRAFVRKIALLAIFAGRKSQKQDRNLPAIIRTRIFRKWTIEQHRGF